MSSGSARPPLECFFISRRSVFRHENAVKVVDFKANQDLEELTKKNERVLQVSVLFVRAPRVFVCVCV